MLMGTNTDSVKTRLDILVNMKTFIIENKIYTFANYICCIDGVVLCRFDSKQRKVIAKKILFNNSFINCFIFYWLIFYPEKRSIKPIGEKKDR